MDSPHQSLPTKPASTHFSDDRQGQSYVYDTSYRPEVGSTVRTEATSTPRRGTIWGTNQRRPVWLIPLAICVLVLVILFEVYKSDFERWVQPLANWLLARKAWSWVIPVVILVVLSFPPLFGHEIVQLVVGLAYPLGIAIGIAIAGSILGEALCFVVFKYFFTGYVEKKTREKLRWAAVSRVAQEVGFKGVLVIRYSIIPPHLANPLFACTGMKFWLYMVTVIISLPKSIALVALGSPSSGQSAGVKAAKIVAITILVIVTIFASRWLRKKMSVAIAEIERERGIVVEDDGKAQGIGSTPLQV